MSPESEKPSPSGSPETRPLWIIAVSLAAIAICLILITVRFQLNRLEAAKINRPEFTFEEMSPEKSHQPPVVRRTYTRPSPEPTVTETVPAASSIPDPATNVASTTLEPVPAYGGFAAEVSALPRTNSAAGIIGHVTLRGVPPDAPPPGGQLRGTATTLPPTWTRLVPDGVVTWTSTGA